MGNGDYSSDGIYCWLPNSDKFLILKDLIHILPMIWESNLIFCTNLFMFFFISKPLNVTRNIDPNLFFNTKLLSFLFVQNFSMYLRIFTPNVHYNVLCKNTSSEGTAKKGANGWMLFIILYRIHIKNAVHFLILTSILIPNL